MYQKIDLAGAVSPLLAGSESGCIPLRICVCARVRPSSATLAAVTKKRWRYTAGLLFLMVHPLTLCMPPLDGWTRSFLDWSKA